MVLFEMLGTIWLVLTALFAVIAGPKNLDFYTIWFAGWAIASGAIGLGWKFAADFWSPPTSSQMAFIGIAAINAGLGFLFAYIGAGKFSETLRRQ